MDSLALIAAFAGLLTALGTLGGSLAILRKAQAEREQIESCASEQITRTALSLIVPLEKRIQALEAERTALLERIGALELERSALLDRLSSLESERTLCTEQIADQETRLAAVEKENAELQGGIAELTRQICEELGASPNWQPPTRRAYVKRSGTTSK